ncbi:hypothetical protein PF011_g13822 [Phytophthora fragariae]|uniref:phosphoglycerate kinase n=1 Tax=Phytophthora fragariae TaxID=53985 RepID=A0A6A3K152_9STRA|nr:hypothetical protein PF011_g13822 [Phytophthora fragariae]
MNESASKSSLASSGGKPSTANSTGSPNGRKTRTIIVARAIPAEPATVVSAAIRGEVASNAVVSQHHTRDARSGKLASYAALGAEEDVERFDRFLAEQRGHPSASELRAAATSPQHMMASMKRKTMSRIQLDGIDGKTSSAEATGEDAAARKLMQKELENDARKRREEAVAHRKWLNSLPIHERVAQQRQQNVLRKWRQMNRDWETFKNRAARRLGKAPQELVMSRAAVYREQREMYDALQKARPLSDKVGGDIWLVSLRNEGTRFVPVGNIFSGLFCPIRESTKLGPRVRRPLDYHDNQREREHEASRPLSKLEKRSLDLLARKKWRLRKQLEVLQPHEVERGASSHLAVGTVDLFAWASGTMEDENSENEDGGSIRTYSASIDDEPSRRRRLRSYASSSPSKSVKKVVPGDQFIGPSMRISHVADEDGVTNTESNGTGHILEPCRPPLRLSFYTPVGEQEQCSLAVTNDGSTIVHYQWWRAPFEDEHAELTAHLRGRRTRKEEQELGRCTTTSVSKLGGTLLPGETEQFVFSFMSSQAGVFLEKWLLDADPKPRICFGATPDDEDNVSSDDLPVEVRLSCVAEDNFAAWRRRQMQLTRVEERESHFFVANLVDEILDRVRPPEPVVFGELTPHTDVAKFYEVNEAAEFNDVYFSPALMRTCYDLFERAQGILGDLLSDQEPVDQEESLTKESGEGHEGVDGTEKTNDAPSLVSPEQSNDLSLGVEDDVEPETTKRVSLPALVVQGWNWRLETLRELCKKADEAQNTQIGRLTQQLKKVIEEVEEDDENEEDDEDENEEVDDTEDGEEDEGGDGSETGEIDAAKAKPISPREVRKNERLARRTALEDEIQSLVPNLQEAFDTMLFSSYTTPYSSMRLQERLYERIGSLCGETPVVCEIAKATNAASSAQAATLEGVGKLLMCAIDEAVGGDQDHQALVEQRRRRIQNMWLSDKASYLSVGQLMIKPPISIAEPPSEVLTADSVHNPAAPKSPESIDNSGVLLMQVDLDLAPWFSLVKVENRGSASQADETPPKIEFAWHISQELVQHPNYVPAKVVQATESLVKVLDALPSTNPLVHTVVLVSELSRPPLTKPMHKLLRNVAQAELKAKATATSQIGGETEEIKDRGSAEGEEAEVEIMKTLLQRLTSQLSLRGIAQVMQRAIQKDVVFCSAVEEVQGQIDFGRKELLLNSSLSLGGIESEAVGNEVEVDSEQQETAISPRILLLEHLGAAGIDLIAQVARQRELASKPATPAPAESQKPAVGAGKKVSVTSKGKPGTPGAPVAPAPAPPPETPPSSTLDLTKLQFAGKDSSEQGAMALRSLFTGMISVCILDGIPSKACEEIFAFGSKEDTPVLTPPTLAGPTLHEELQMWSEMLQPRLPGSSSGRPLQILTAVVGGKSLESKLRMIDGLLEIVHEIYFVGEVAMSLYRILHTKHAGKLAKENYSGTKHEEVEEEFEDDVSKEGIVEDEANEHDREKETSEHFPPVRTSPKGIWDLLVPAVEKLQQKASRKSVRLLLPNDWVVGETPLEEQDLSAATIVEDDDDDDDDEEEEQADEVDDEEDRGKKTRKRRASELASARLKPLVEPSGADFFDRKRQGTYEGERAHVVLNPSSESGWRTFREVSAQCLPSARVTEGKASVLHSLWPESEADDAEDESDDMAGHKTPMARFEYEWTFRALDVGPIAMEGLTKALKPETPCVGLDDPTANGDTSVVSRALIVNGVCGAIEFYEFCAATKQLLGILQLYSPCDVFIAGYSTASRIHQLEIEQFYNAHAMNDKISGTSATANGNAGSSAAPRKVVDDRTKRNARVLKQLLAAKRHPVLANLASSESE